MRSLRFGCGVLTAVVLIALIPTLYVASHKSGTDGVIVALVAAVTCWVSSCAALILTTVMCSKNPDITGVMAGMLLRTGVPLVVAFILNQSSSFMATNGIFGWILVFYLVTLFVETILSVRYLTALKGALKVSQTAD